MPKTEAPWSRLLATAAFIALPATAAGVPSFCAPFQVPPATCEAEKALPCTGACPADNSNSFGAWKSYWGRCEATKSKQPGFVKDQFTCNSTASKLYLIHYAPANQWVCCIKDPFMAQKSEADGLAAGAEPKAGR